MGSITLHKQKVERSNKVQKYSQLRKITDLLRYVEMCVVMVLISRLSFQQLPLALKSSTEYFRGFEISPGVVFVIGNVIIMTLFAQSGHFSNDSSKRKNSEHDMYLEFLQNSNMYQRIQGSDQRKLSVKVESSVKSRRIIDGSMVKASEIDVKKSDDEGMKREMDLEVKEYRRCQSEIELVRGVDSDNETDKKVLQRCESENEKSDDEGMKREMDLEKKLTISRMSDPSLIKSIKNSLSIPVISAARVGHFVEAQILQAIGVDYIDETEILTPADDQNHINKHKFQIPFISGARSLGEALQRIREGAIMIRLQGELTNSGNISETVKNVRCLMKELRVLTNMDDDEVFTYAKRIEAPYDLLAQTKQMRRLPVLHFAAGGIVTPADAALMMQLGCNGVFVGSEIFEYEDAINRVKGIVQAVKNYNNPHVLVETMMMGLNLGGDNRIEDGSFEGENV